jgi:hypothetical protein
MTRRTSDPFDLNKVELSSSVTVGKYREMEGKKDLNGLADFIGERLSERYIGPLQTSSEKHGFLMMAAVCLLTETLESFYQGWPTTDKGIPRKDIQDPCKPTDPKRTTVSSSEVAFCYFFQRELAFSPLRSYSQDFYVHVRCGILHQGETTGGWRIWREGALFDDKDLTVNADTFLAEVKKAVQTYTDKLRNAAWNDDLSNNFRNKMDAIIDHCKR